MIKKKAEQLEQEYQAHKENVVKALGQSSRELEQIRSIQQESKEIFKRILSNKN
jgi:hypothetical protein